MPIFYNPTPNEEKMTNPTPPHPIISYGTLDHKILSYIKNNPNQTLNIKRLHRDMKIARSSIYDSLKRLQLKLLIDNERNITELGIKNLTQISKGNRGVGRGVRKGVGTSRWECRTGHPTGHRLHYRFLINYKPHDIKGALKELTKKEPKVNKLKNFKEYYGYAKDCTIVVKKHTMYIHIEEKDGADIDKLHYEAFQTALKWSLKLCDAGFGISEMRMESAHYVRIETALAKRLQKIDDKYSVNLPNGGKFYIDHSKGLEEETNDPEFRERLDEFLLDLSKSKSNLTDLDRIDVDLDKMKNILVKQVELNNGILKMQLNQNNNEIQNKGASYFG